VIMTNVKLTKNTQSILKNFSTLNSNILINEGNVIKTMSPQKNVMAQAVVEETFPVDFGIWDLNKFLSVISLFDDPEFMFEEKHVMINGGRKSSVKYHYCEPSLLTVPTKDIKMPDSALNISLTDSTFNELMKASSVLQLMDLRICPSDDGDEIIAKLHDAADSTSNKYYISLGDNPVDVNYNFDFKMNLLRFVPGNYTIDFTETVISQFSHDSLDLTYWVALETTSKYGD